LCERGRRALISLQRCEQMGDRESQGIRDAHETQDREVALALLNLTEVRGIQACSGGEGRLGKTLVLPGLTDGRPKEQQRRLVVRRGMWQVVLCDGRIPYRSRGEKVTGCRRSKWSTGIDLGEKPGGRNT